MSARGACGNGPQTGNTQAQKSIDADILRSARLALFSFTIDPGASAGGLEPDENQSGTDERATTTDTWARLLQRCGSRPSVGANLRRVDEDLKPHERCRAETEA